MDDLISRQKAIMDAESWVAVDEHEKHLQKNVIEWLKEFPPAQPEPHEGYWIEVAGELECSECHTVFTDLYPDYVDSVACPHCGAKMKGERQK